VGTYNALPDPLAELRGPLCCGEGRGRKKKERRREKKEGKGCPSNKNRGYTLIILVYWMNVSSGNQR